MSKYDASSGAGHVSTASPLEFSHTVGNGWGGFLLVFVSVGHESYACTGVTYAGESMTYTTGRNPSPQDAGNAWIKQYVYRLPNPRNGTNTVSVAHTGTYDVYAAAVSCMEVDLSDPFYAWGSGTGWDENVVGQSLSQLSGQVGVGFVSTWRLVQYESAYGANWTKRVDSNNNPSGVDTHAGTRTATSGNWAFSHDWWQNYSLGIFCCSLRTGSPPAGGTWVYSANKWKDFLRNLKQGTIPRDMIAERYREVLAT